MKGQSGKGGRKANKLPSVDPILGAGRKLANYAAKRQGSEGPKKSVKGPVKGGPATGKGRPANKKAR